MGNRGGEGSEYEAYLGSITQTVPAEPRQNPTEDRNSPFTESDAGPTSLHDGYEPGSSRDRHGAKEPLFFDIAQPD